MTSQIRAPNTEFIIPYSEWCVAGSALSYRVVTSLPLCSREVLLSRLCYKVIAVDTPDVRHIHLQTLQGSGTHLLHYNWRSTLRTI